jgi:hypothetical protein
MSTEKRQQLSAAWELEHLGNAGVDSGELKIIDPCYNNQEAAVLAKIPQGDGIFPVFTVRENGVVRGIYIDLKWSPPDKDGEGRVALGNLTKTARNSS